jgi:competence protein ComEC
LIAALSLLAGVLLGLGSAAIPGPAYPWAAAGLFAAWLLSSLRHRPWARAAAMMLVGQFLVGMQAACWLDLRVPVDGADSRALVEGTIVNVPSRDGASLRFDLRGRFLQADAVDARERRFRVQWRDDRAAPRVGEQWRLLLRLVPLEESRNFAGFESARLAFRERVHGAGWVLPSAMNTLRRLAPASLDTLRARIALRIRERVADPDAAALVTALAVGLTPDMSRDQWRVFNATGTTHLVAISGMHVTLFAWLAFRAGRIAWRWLPLRRSIGREPFALLLGLACAGGYALLAGWSVPTQRTWLMLALYVGARLSARQVAPGRLWALALVLVLLSDLLAPLSAGFWLSFVAVGVLLAAGEARPVSARSRLAALARLQLAVMVALAPAGFAVFGSLSLAGLAVNLVAIPVVSFLFVPMVLAGALAAWWYPPGCDLFFGVSAFLYDTLWPAMVWCADLGHASWRAAPPLWWFALALPAALVWWCRGPWPLRATALCALLPLLFPQTRAPPSAAAIITVLDVGRGTAVLVRTRSRTVLYDTGDAWGTRGVRLVSRVLPALDAKQIRVVDLLVLPSLDGDRARAAALLAWERGVARIETAGHWPGSGLPVGSCVTSRWNWDGVRFELLPSGRHCELRLRIADTTLRLSAEAGSSTQWIETPSPGLAVATGGIEGAQTRARALDRRRAQGFRVLDTHAVGALELEFDARGVELRATARGSRFPFHWRRPV